MPKSCWWLRDSADITPARYTCRATIKMWDDSDASAPCGHDDDARARRWRVDMMRAKDKMCRVAATPSRDERRCASRYAESRPTYAASAWRARWCYERDAANTDITRAKMRRCRDEDARVRAMMRAMPQRCMRIIEIAMPPRYVSMPRCRVAYDVDDDAANMSRRHDWVRRRYDADAMSTMPTWACDVDVIRQMMPPITCRADDDDDTIRAMMRCGVVRDDEDMMRSRAWWWCRVRRSRAMPIRVSKTHAGDVLIKTRRYAQDDDDDVA